MVSFLIPLGYERGVSEQGKRIASRVAPVNPGLSKAEFVALLSHQLKTPVTSLKLKLQLANRLLTNRSSSPEAFEQLRKVLNHADRDADRVTEIISAFQERAEAK